MSAVDFIIGIHPANSPIFDNKKKDDILLKNRLNLLTMCGWFPLVGTISGIVRLIFTELMYKNDSESRKVGPQSMYFYNIMRLRAVVEITGLGSLLFVADMMVTIGRLIPLPPPLSSSQLWLKK